MKSTFEVCLNTHANEYIKESSCLSVRWFVTSRLSHLVFAAHLSSFALSHNKIYTTSCSSCSSYLLHTIVLALDNVLQRDVSRKKVEQTTSLTSSSSSLLLSLLQHRQQDHRHWKSSRHRKPIRQHRPIWQLYCQAWGFPPTQPASDAVAEQ